MFAMIPGRTALRWAWRPTAVLALGALGLITAGFTYQLVETANDARRLAPPGRLVDVGGYRLHLDCVGEGTSTVILEHGLGSPAVNWTWVQQGIARFTRVCSYDRAGYGWSDPSPRARTAGVMAEELHTLLSTAGETGPYVVAAHSFGGLPARVFAGRYSREVVGLVFADVTHPAQFGTTCVPACLPRQVAQKSGSLYRTTPWLASVGVLRLGNRLGLVPLQAATAGLPAEVADVITAELSKTAYWQTSAAEFWGIPVSVKEATDAGGFGDRPLKIVTAGHTYYSDEIKVFTGDVDPRRVTESWLTLQHDLTRLSRRSVETVVANADHVSLITDPQFAPAVVEAVRGVVTQVNQR